MLIQYNTIYNIKTYDAPYVKMSFVGAGFATIPQYVIVWQQSRRSLLSSNHSKDQIDSSATIAVYKGTTVSVITSTKNAIHLTRKDLVDLIKVSRS